MSTHQRVYSSWLVHKNISSLGCVPVSSQQQQLVKVTWLRYVTLRHSVQLIEYIT